MHSTFFTSKNDYQNLFSSIKHELPENLSATEATQLYSIFLNLEGNNFYHLLTSKKAALHSLNDSLLSIELNSVSQNNLAVAYLYTEFNQSPPLLYCPFSFKQESRAQRLSLRKGFEFCAEKIPENIADLEKQYSYLEFLNRVKENLDTKLNQINAIVILILKPNVTIFNELYTKLKGIFDKKNQAMPFIILAIPPNLNPEYYQKELHLSTDQIPQNLLQFIRTNFIKSLNHSNIPITAIIEESCDRDSLLWTKLSQTLHTIEQCAMGLHPYLKEIQDTSISSRNKVSSSF